MKSMKQKKKHNNYKINKVKTIHKKKENTIRKKTRTAYLLVAKTCIQLVCLQSVASAQFVSNRSSQSAWESSGQWADASEQAEKCADEAGIERERHGNPVRGKPSARGFGPNVCTAKFPAVRGGL